MWQNITTPHLTLIFCTPKWCYSNSKSTWHKLRITFNERTHRESFWEGLESLWCLTFWLSHSRFGYHVEDPSVWKCLKYRYIRNKLCLRPQLCCQIVVFPNPKDLYKQLYLHPHAMSQVTIHLQPKNFTRLWVGSFYFTNQKYLKRSSCIWCRKKKRHS